MRMIFPALPLIAVLLLAPNTSCLAAVGNDGSGTVVITFKDGHQQSFEASTITEMAFKSAAGATTPMVIPSAFIPGRRHFVGKWIVGVGNGGSFYIELDDQGGARKSMGETHGTWTYVNGEAHISWDDGWHDAIRKTGSKHEKFAYSPGKSFSADPSNVTEARFAKPQPI